MIERAEPPRTEAAGGREQLAGRRHGLSAREKWGYGVWLFTGLVFGIPETWAGVANPPWPTLSNTVWYLESLWSPVAIAVVVLIVFIIFCVVRHPPAQAGYVVTRDGEPGRGRTASGRLTRSSAESVNELPYLLTFPSRWASLPWAASSPPRRPATCTSSATSSTGCSRSLS